jgi:hypothetical protein
MLRFSVYSKLFFRAEIEVLTPEIEVLICEIAVLIPKIGLLITEIQVLNLISAHS